METEPLELTSNRLPDVRTEDSLLVPRVVSLATLAWENRGFVLKVVFIGVLISAGIALLIPNTYEATARLMPPQSHADTGMMLMQGAAAKLGDLAPMAQDLMGNQESGALFTKALATETILNRLVDRFDLKKVYRVKLQEDARDKLAARTEINEDRRSGVVEITVRDHDKNRAAELANAYVQELDRLLTEVSTSTASRERLFLENRMELVKQQMDAAELALSQFSSKSGAINIEEQGKALFESTAKLQGELVESEADLKGLLQVYSSDNSRVRAEQAHVNELKKALAQATVGSTAQTDSNSPTLPIRTLPTLGQAYANLYRQAKTEEGVYEMLSREYESAKLEEVRQVPTIRVLDPANPPDRKSGPKRLYICLAGAMFSLCGAMAWLLVKKRFNDSPDDDFFIFWRGVTADPRAK